jgi:serine/threonine protein kinase
MIRRSEPTEIKLSVHKTPPSVKDELSPAGRLVSFEQIIAIKNYFSETPNKVLPSEALKQFGVTHEVLKIGDHYFVVAKLGSIAKSGGTGEIKYAQDMESGKWYALKIQPLDDYSRAEDYKDSAAKLKSAQEIKSACDYEHGLIREVGLTNFDYLLTEGEDIIQQKHYMLMELINGKNLRSLLRSRTPISGEHWLNIAINIIEELNKLHKLGIFHGDIRPDNYVIDVEQSRVVAIDFGISTRKSDISDKNFVDIPTIDELLLFAPELRIYNGINLAYTPLTEAYSLGVMLMELFGLQSIEEDGPSKQSFYNEVNLPFKTRRAIVSLLKSMVKSNPSERIDVETALYKMKEIRQELTDRIEEKATLRAGAEVSSYYATSKQREKKISEEELKGKTTLGAASEVNSYRATMVIGLDSPKIDQENKIISTNESKESYDLPTFFSYKLRPRTKDKAILEVKIPNPYPKK